MEQFFSFVVNNWLLWSGFIVVLLLLIAYEYTAHYGGAERISIPQAVRLMNQAEGVVFDIRQQDAFNQGHIRGAINIPLKELPDSFKRINRYKHKPIIVACEMGASATQAAKILSDNGFEQSHVMQGGMQAWNEAGLPTVKESNQNKSSVKKATKSANKNLDKTK